MPQGLRPVTDSSPFEVPAAPNGSAIRGKVLGIKETSEGGQVWEVLLEESKDLGSLPNFTKSRIGETISVYLAPETGVMVRESDDIEAHVSFHGDEHGGAFYIADGSVRKRTPNR